MTVDQMIAALTEISQAGGGERQVFVEDAHNGLFMKVDTLEADTANGSEDGNCPREGSDYVRISAE